MKKAVYLIVFFAITLFLLTSCLSIYHGIQDSVESSKEKKMIDQLCTLIDKLFGEKGKSEEYFKKRADGSYILSTYDGAPIANTVSADDNYISLYVNNEVANFSVIFSFSGNRIDEVEYYFKVKELDARYVRLSIQSKSGVVDNKGSAIIDALDSEVAESFMKFVRNVPNKADAEKIVFECFDSDFRPLSDDKRSTFSHYTETAYFQYVSKIVELYDRAVSGSGSSISHVSLTKEEELASNMGYAYFGAPFSGISADGSFTGPVIDTKTKTLYYRYAIHTYPYYSDGLSLSDKVAFVLFSNEKLPDVYVVPVNNSDYIQIDDGLLHYLLKGPDNSVIRVEFYNNNRNRVSGNYKYYDYQYKTTRENRLSDYKETFRVKTVKDFVNLLNELGGKKSTRIYSDSSSDFYLNGKSQLCLDYSTYSRDHIDYGLRDEPKYLILRSENTDRNMVLDIGNEGTYKADTKLLKFICSCPDGDIIRMEYYTGNWYRISYNKRTYDSKGNASRTTISEWYETFDVTTAKKLIRQWQSMDGYDYLANWEIDREATADKILGLTD